jgi:uncharacterized protein (DUF362 family)
VDLNEDEFIKVQAHNRDLQPVLLRVARTVVESDYRISICPPRTHDSVIVTLSLRNMLVVSLVWDDKGNDKKALDRGYRAMNLSLLKLARVIPPPPAFRRYQTRDGPSLRLPITKPSVSSLSTSRTREAVC